LQSEKAEGQ